MSWKSIVRRVAGLAGQHLSPIALLPERTLLGLIHSDVDLVLDVGANVGQFAADIRRSFPSAHIVSFEPTPHAFAQLKEVAALDGRHAAFNCALGATEGALEMNVHTDHTPSSSLLAATAKSVELFPETARQAKVTVAVHRLDDMNREHQWPVSHRTLLKLDVQGYEEHVLAGATETLARVGACVAEVCLEPLYDGQGTFHGIAQRCHDAGLSYAGNLSQVYGPDGRVQYLDALFVRPGVLRA